MAKQRPISDGRAKQQSQPRGGDNGLAQNVLEGEEPRGSSALSQVEFNARVARKAFELFERRGGDVGRDVEDWLEAERLVQEELRREDEL
jgi:hypothetical protein